VRYLLSDATGCHRTVHKLLHTFGSRLHFSSSSSPICSSWLNPLRIGTCMVHTAAAHKTVGEQSAREQVSMMTRMLCRTHTRVSERSDIKLRQSSEQSASATSPHSDPSSTNHASPQCRPGWLHVCDCGGPAIPHLFMTSASSPLLLMPAGQHPDADDRPRRSSAPFAWKNTCTNLTSLLTLSLSDAE
jgi:hypothetical protein